MVTDQQEPDWVASLREQEQGTVETPQEQTVQTDMLEDLREQMIQAEEALDVEARSPLARLFTNFEPWQRLVLAGLLFLNIAVCGCMALVVTGRVVFSF